MELSVLLFGLKALLPGLGQVIYTFPKVRRYTRWIVSTFGAVQSYIILLGLPPAEVIAEPAVVAPTMATASVIGTIMVGSISWLWTNPLSQIGLSLLSGWVDGKVGQYRHRANKYRKIVKPTG